MKALSRFALVVVLLVTTVGVASAAFTGPYVDTWVTVGGTNNPSGNTLYVQDSLSSCNDTQITYFQFSAQDIQTVSGATLVLTAASTQIGLGSSPQLSIYGVADFEPASLTGSNAPLTTGVTAIQTIGVPSGTVVGNKFTFGGADPGLRNYIQSQAGGTVSLALSFSSACDGNNSQMNFYSQRYNTDTSRRPQLTVEGTKPNAVNLTETSAERVAWPLYVGLGALAVIVLGGVFLSRRKTA